MDYKTYNRQTDSCNLSIKGHNCSNDESKILEDIKVMLLSPTLMYSQDGENKGEETQCLSTSTFIPCSSNKEKQSRSAKVAPDM